MKKCECVQSLQDAFQSPAVAFALGAFCGLAIGMICLPFSKGIVIGSYNDNPHVEHDYVAPVSDEE